MAQEIDKIIKSTTPPKSKDVLWDNGKELLINRNGKWEKANSGGNEEFKDWSGAANFLNNTNTPGGILNMPFGYEGGAYNEATIDATPGEWVFVLTPKMYYLDKYVINGVEITAPNGDEEVIFSMGSYQIKVKSDYSIYVYAFYPQTITISCRTYESKKIMSSNFVRNDTINLSTEEGVSTLRFLLENYGYYGLLGRIFTIEDVILVCTYANGASNFVNFSIMGFKNKDYCNITVTGGISYPLNMTTTIKKIKLEE